MNFSAAMTFLGGLSAGRAKPGTTRYFRHERRGVYPESEPLKSGA
jgi:hypothetical protein